MIKIKEFPNVKEKFTTGTYDGLILIDNKEINKLIGEGRAAQQMGLISGQVETQLAKRMGFKGKGTDLSKKGDFQQFNLQLADQAIAALEDAEEAAKYSPATMGFLQALKGTAIGPGYLEGRPSRVTKGPDEGAQVGGLGAELKLGEEIFDIRGFKDLPTSAFSKRTLTQETGMRDATAPLGGPQAGYTMERLKEVKGRTKIPAGQFFEELLYNEGLARKIFKDATKLKGVLQKTRNLFTLISFKGKGKQVVNFLYFIKDLKPAKGDITGNLDGPRIQWKYTAGFEQKVVTRVSDMLGEDGANAIESGTIRNKVGALGLLSLSDDLAKMEISTRLNTVASIPVPYVANIKIPALRKQKISPQRRPARRGQFISNVQFSALLQKRLAEKMPRYPEPRRPTPRYVTGRLARSFQIMTNYRQGIIGFFNTPPASGYVDELNENGWLLDQTLVQPTIRQITQQLFGRQFRVLRTQ